MAMYLVTFESCMFDSGNEVTRVAKSREDVDNILKEFDDEGYFNDGENAVVFQLGKKMTAFREVKFALKGE